MNGTHPLGTIAHLWRYPVKALAAEPLVRAEIASYGLVGDRRAALFVESEGHARTGKTFRGKEHNLLHTVAGIDEATQLAAKRDVSVTARGDGPYFDDSPISLIFDAWLREAEALVGYELDPLRYRPNLFVHAAPDFTRREADLVGSTILVHDVRLRVNDTIRRCVTTTYDIPTGASDPNVLRAVAQHRENVMGIYCVVENPGTVAIGDELAVAG